MEDFTVPAVPESPQACEEDERPDGGVEPTW